MGGGGQVLENERGWLSMPGGWYGAKLFNVDFSRDAKSVTLVHSAAEGAKNSPVTVGENRTLVRLLRFSSPPSMRCESPTGPTEELQPNVHRHGT